MSINQLKLEVHDTYGKDEKITTNFEAVNDENTKKPKLTWTENYPENTVIYLFQKKTTTSSNYNTANNL